MSPTARLLSFVVGMCLAAFSCELIWAMGQESFGPAGADIGRSADWPKGVEDILRHPSRVYHRWVNGNENAYYHGEISEVNELLDLFSRLDLNVHRVVVRSGSPQAQSFQGKLVPYNVEFEVASGIFLSHIQENIETGLYCAIPRLTIHVDDKFAKLLDQLKVPENVSLCSEAFRAEDALEQLNSDDRSMHWRAISVLGDACDAKPAIIEALKHAKKGGDANLRGAAERAIDKINQLESPAARQLHQTVTEYLQNHPQLARVPNPDQLLAKLRGTDARCADGFCAKGTLTRLTPSGRSRLIAWTVTMGDGQLVIQQQSVVNEDNPPQEGPDDTTLYVGPRRMGTLHGSRLWVDGTLIDAKPHATFEPVGSTYDLLIGRILWPLGRGYTRRIDRITEVSVRPDGNYEVVAASDKSLRIRWELRVDPNADFLIRHAKAYLHDHSTPSYVVDNLGVIGRPDCCTAHTARWTNGAHGQPVSISITSVSGRPDMELIDRTANELESQADR